MKIISVNGYHATVELGGEELGTLKRINCVPPQELTRAHLFAEIRELPRVRHLMPRKNVPASYRMGKGHVLFFMDKGGYLEKRHRALLDEWQRRGHECSIPALSLGWEAAYMQDWHPGEVAITTNRQRIAERLGEMMQ